VVITPTPPAGETDIEKQARIKKESEAEKARAAEAAEKAKSAETKAAEAAAKKAAEEAAAKKAAEEKAKKDAEDKSKAKETANITVLDNGARVLDDVLELVKQGVPVVSNVRTQKEQEALVDHTDDKGNRFTKENLPVAENSKHLTGDALDVRVKDMTKDLEKILKDNGWMRPLPKSDPGHWQRVPKPKEKKTSEVVPNDVDLASALSQAFDLSDATAGLTINSDVATLNSKGMNVSLDNSADVAKMIAAISPDMAEAFRSSSQADQSAAKASFESSMGDVKSALAEQKATNVALLDAMQELIRIQKNSVDVQQKIYNVTA
jgi:vacuolar-type H+-ATPase subunit E/Vma4